jgi:hypothetical protein
MVPGLVFHSDGLRACHRVEGKTVVNAANVNVEIGLCFQSVGKSRVQELAYSTGDGNRATSKDVSE